MSVHAEVLNWLRLCPEGFHLAHPSRRVNNVYFDSHAMGAVSDHIGGAGRRAKVRLRWYGMSEWPDAGALEIKLKWNEFSWKKRFAASGGLGSAKASWTRARACLRSQLPLEGRIWLESYPLPVVINRYRREYWVSADGRVRVTLDTEQATFDQGKSPRPNITRCAQDHAVVLEVKFQLDDRRLAARFLDQVPLARIRNSKYVTAFERHRLE